MFFNLDFITPSLRSYIWIWDDARTVCHSQLNLGSDHYFVEVPSGALSDIIGRKDDRECWHSHGGGNAGLRIAPRNLDVLFGSRNQSCTQWSS